MEVRQPILIMGLPGAGKTTLARALAPHLRAVHFNNDDVRQNINRDLGFSFEDRVEQARRMRWMCDRVLEAGHAAIADFVCPLQATRAAFGDCFLVWVDRIQHSRYPDTDRIFEPPVRWGVRVTPQGDVDHWVRETLAAYPKESSLVP
jgi:hypothetical protein